MLQRKPLPRSGIDSSVLVAPWHFVSYSFFLMDEECLTPTLSSSLTAFAGFSLAARRHSRVRPKVTLLNYASPMTAVSRPLNEVALTPLTEQEGEAYLEKCGSVRRHTVANAHSDIQLLAMATMMHSGLGEEPGGEDKCLLLPPSFSPPHRQCSSEPNITDSPDELEEGAGGSQEDPELNSASLS